MLRTGVLSSRPTSRDIKIDGFSMGLNGIELIQDCSIELTIGRRYGLIGQNGCGKTNFLQVLANREVGLKLRCCTDSLAPQQSLSNSQESAYARAVAIVTRMLDAGQKGCKQISPYYQRQVQPRIT